jgi:precorrin-6B methylase 1
MNENDAIVAEVHERGLSGVFKEISSGKLVRLIIDHKDGSVNVADLETRGYTVRTTVWSNLTIATESWATE